MYHVPVYKESRLLGSLIPIGLGTWIAIDVAMKANEDTEWYYGNMIHVEMLTANLNFNFFICL